MFGAQKRVNNKVLTWCSYDSVPGSWCVLSACFPFCLQVAWEIQTASASLSSINDNAFDLFLLGTRMPGVKSMPELRRLNTETYVYCFDATNNGKAMELLQCCHLCAV